MVTDASALDDRRRNLALSVLCLGVLMNTLNGTIVNVALPLIGADLGFGGGSLAWVINAYLAAYGGCLLLGGRLGDLFGHRRVLLAGVAIFTAASLGCGLATSGETLIAARAMQGVGGAIVSATGLSLITKLFADSRERAKAFGIYAFVSACSSSVGMLVGGIVTSSLGWHWTFLINVPAGISVWALGMLLVPPERVARSAEHLDWGGAVTVTAATLVAVYTLLDHGRAASNNLHTLATLAIALLLLGTFISIESKVRKPLIPLSLFRGRHLLVAASAGALLSAVVLAWTFVSALYLQRLLSWSALQTGFAFLPANLATAITSLVLTPRMISRYGVGAPMVTGFTLAAAGLFILVHSLTSATTLADTVPGMFLVGLGVGLIYSPAILGALRGIAPDQAGVVSGIINTSFAVGGALGLAALAAIAAAASDEMIAAGATLHVALEAGYQRALYAGVVLALAGALISALFLQTKHLRAPEAMMQQTR